MRKNLLPTWMLAIALLPHANKLVAQQNNFNLPAGSTPLHSIAADRMRVPDLKKPFIAFGNTQLLSQTGTASGDAQQPVLQFTGVSADIILSDIPFSFRHTSNTGWRDLEPLHFGAAQFDKEKYLRQIGERLKKIAKPEELFASFLSDLYAKRDRAIETIRNDLSAISVTGNDGWMKNMQNKVNADNIAYLGVDQLLDKLMATNGNEIGRKENYLQQLQHKDALQPGISDSISMLGNEIAALHQAKDQVSGQVAALRKKWFESGVMETIGSFEKQKQSILDKLMKDPAAIAKLASQHLSLRGLQKMFLNAQSFDLGTSQAGLSDLQLKDALLKGLNTAFLKNNKYLAPIIGSQPGIKNIAEAGYANMRELPDILTSTLRMGKGDIHKDFSHVSVSMFQQSNNLQLLQDGLMQSLPKNFVTTISKRMSFGENHYLLTEISKSTMIYNNASREKGDGLKNMVNSGNLMENMGIALDYGSELENIGLTHRITIRYTGKEYQNLGNAFLAGGTKEIGTDLKKHFLARRLVLHTRVNYRQYEFSVNDRKWQSLSYMADVKWKMKKGEFIEFRYQPYFNQSNTQQENRMSSQSHRIALRGNINRKISRGFSYRNFIELASSKDNFYDFIYGGGTANTFLSFTSLQTITLGKRTLFVNITANRAKQNTGYLFGNSSLSADVGAQFSSGNRIMLSSSVVYNKVSALYEQLAARQSLSAFLGKRLIVEGYLQAGVNFFEADNLDLPLTTGNLSISYNLK